MRITYPTRSRSLPVITLGRTEKAVWQATTADGRDIDATRCAISARARALIEAGAKIVDVFAPAEAGGFQVERFVAHGDGIERRC